MCSHSAWGQEAWQIVSQWVWNLRLELGHHLHPDPVRTTEFAPAHQETIAASPPPQGYAPASAASSWKTGRFTGSDAGSPARWNPALPCWSVLNLARTALGSQRE